VLRRLIREAGKAFGQTGKVGMLEGSTSHKVAGTSYHQDALEAIAGGHGVHGHDIEVMATLIPEPQNPHDRNAVAVRVDGRQVGHIARETAAEIQKLIIDAQRQHGVDICCRARIVGGWDDGEGDRGHFGMRLFFDIVD